MCENHIDKAWPDACDCGAGAPCPNCNELASDYAKAMVLHEAINRSGRKDKELTRFAAVTIRTSATQHGSDYGPLSLEYHASAA